MFVQSHLFMKKAKCKRVPSRIKTYEHSVAKKLSKLIYTPTEYFLVVSQNWRYAKYVEKHPLMKLL